MKSKATSKIAWNGDKRERERERGEDETKLANNTQKIEIPNLQSKRKKERGSERQREKQVTHSIVEGVL